MATDRASHKMQEAGALTSFITGGVAVADAPNTIAAVHSDLFPIYKSAADGAAATATAETYTGIYLPQVQGLNPTTGQRAYRVNGAYINFAGAGVTADATNNATITITARDQNGLNPVVVATLVTNLALGSAVIGATKAFTLATTNPAVLPFGTTFTYTIAKGGTGVVIPVSVITLDVEAI